tara:strand:+ start:393 stop:509 length:117 start_codon:yes stop_codon:yes gene_type:complete
MSFENFGFLGFVCFGWDNFLMSETKIFNFQIIFIFLQN